jgi:hypothetical protein
MDRKVSSDAESAGRGAERGSVLPHPPGPSLAATTSDVRPRPTFIISRESMTFTGYTRLADGPHEDEESAG